MLPNKTILVIENGDTENNKGAFARLVPDIPHRMITATSSEDGLKKFLAHPVDLVITDIKTPGADGIELIKKMKRIDPGLMVIILSAFEDFNPEIFNIGDGIYFFIKPFNSGEVRRAIKYSFNVRNLIRSRKRLPLTKWDC